MRSLLIGLCAALVTVAAPTAQHERHDDREAFTAVAISPGGPRTTPVAARLEIVIERWSTDAERQRLIEAATAGQQTLLEALRELPRVGFIRSGGALGWDLQYAHQVPGEDGGRRIVLATDRPISAWEAINQPITARYPFTFVELRMSAQGEGEGRLSQAVRVTATDGGRFIDLQNYAAQPIRLTEVEQTE